jgi:hypothetical protein
MLANFITLLGTRVKGSSANPYVTSIGLASLGVQRINTNFSPLENVNSASSTFDWSILDSSLVEQATGSVKQPTFNLDTLGFYDIDLTVDRTNSLKRYYPRLIKVRPDPFTEGEADVVFDLSAVQAGTFSNPLGDASVTGNGTTNFLYDFDDVERAGLKIYVKGSYSGRINFTGLRGTEANPVRIQCPTSGRATFTATNGSQPYCWQFTTGNQYIEIDGSASSDNKYGFLLQGYIAGATGGQMLFFSGSAQRGFHIHGVECDGRKNDPGSLLTGAGAAIQFQPPTPTSGQHAGNWSWGAIIVHDCYVHENEGEAMYFNYFSDGLQGGFRPDRMAALYVFDNIIHDCGRDGIQWASTDYFEIFRNDVRRTGQFDNTDGSHISAFSLNDGNLTGYVYQNYVEDADAFLSGQNGATGTNANYYIFSNYGKQRDPILYGSGNQFLYLAVDSAACDYHVFNNTFVCSAVVVAPVAIQHNNVGTFECLNFTFAGNVILTSGTNQSTWLELRRVNTPADTSNWFISNTWRRVADESQLQLDTSYVPDEITSPAYGSGFDWSDRFVGVDFPTEGQRDYHGYSLKVGNSPESGLGWTSGAYVNHALWIPDSTAPSLTAEEVNSIQQTEFVFEVDTDENATVYYVVIPEGGTAPSAAQIIAGNNASDTAATASGSKAGRGTIVQTVIGLTAATAYDLYAVGVDGSGNQSTVVSVLNQTTSAAATQVTLAEVGALSGTVGVNQRASTGTLTPAQAVTGDLAAGDLLIVMVSIRATGGTADVSGYTEIATHRMGTTSNGEFYIFGKIADGTESGSVTVTFPNDFGVTKMARCYRFKNNNPASVAAAIESIAEGQGTSNTYAAQSVTSTVNLALAVQFVAVGDDNVTGSFTGESGGDYTEDATHVYTGGTGGAHSVQTAELATAGSITGGTFVMAASDPWGVIGLVIKP